MGSGVGFSKFLVMAAKLFVTVTLFVLIGIPLLTGAGIGLLVMIINIVSNLFLSLFSNPLGMFFVGVVFLVMFRRRREQQSEDQRGDE